MWLFIANYYLIYLFVLNVQSVVENFYRTALASTATLKNKITIFIMIYRYVLSLVLFQWYTVPGFGMFYSLNFASQQMIEYQV